MLYCFLFQELKTVPPPEQFALPDLDLHAYTPDGKHVGMNYETGIFEMQIPGVIASGGFYNSSEWISVPEDSAAYFVISSRPTALFLEEHPDLPPENEEGLYALSVSYFDENLDGVGSGLEELTIAPGAEVFHLVEIRLMPDDNYQLEIREGLDLMSLEAWEAAVDNIPDELFINNPSQRKGALKNKLRAIFAKVKKKNYHGVINQIQNDLLKKLNADGKADWVKEPVLVEELGALTAMLKYKWR